MFNINFTHDWIRTADNQPMSHNHCPEIWIFCFPIPAQASAETDDNETTESGDEFTNLSDYYDPEDITGAGSVTEAAVLKEKLLSDKVLRFRNGGCRRNTKLFDEIPLFNAAPKKLTRFFLSLGAVYSTGSSKLTRFLQTIIFLFIDNLYGPCLPMVAIWIHLEIDNN